MSVELMPLGVQCNLACTYCYQHPMRDAGNFSPTKQYDMDAMLQALTTEGQKFTVFGGEALLVPLEDLEKIFAFGLKQYKENNVQTNGALITDAHIELFKKYRVHVGMSVDGPEELNDHRWAGSLEKTRAATKKSFEAIDKCMTQGLPISFIVTLHRHNAARERRPRLKEWIRSLDRAPCRGFRLHTLEVDHELVDQHLALTTEEQIEAFLDMHTLSKEMKVIGFDVFTDINKLLRGDDRSVTCTWTACDSYTTRAVQGIDGQGRKSNCGRTNKEGVMFLKGDTPGYERNAILYHTPYEHGGCSGCRFFALCKGHCPGEAIDGDWRNRTASCEFWMAMFQRIEQDMLAKGEVPFSFAPHRHAVEKRMVEGWSKGHNWTLHGTIEEVTKGLVPKAGTVVDTAAGFEFKEPPVNREHGDSPHGDSSGHGDAPHGDDHGDHYDSLYSHGDAPHEDDHGDAPHGDAPHGDHYDDAFGMVQVPVGRPVE